MSATEIPDFVTPRVVEDIYRRSVELRRLQENERHRLFRQTTRALKARDPRLLIILDKGSEIMARLAEEQYGRTNRTATDLPQRVPPTEARIWTEAYRLADEGGAIDPGASVEYSPFHELYTAAAMFAGLVH